MLIYIYTQGEKEVDGLSQNFFETPGLILMICENFKFYLNICFNY